MTETSQNSYTRHTTQAQARLEVIDGGRQEYKKATYSAYGIDKPNNRTARIRIVMNDPDQMVFSMAKSYLVEIQYSAKSFIALIFTNCVFMLEGMNLDDLVEKLGDDQIKSISGFNAKLHVMLTEDTPVISRIRRISLDEMTESRDAP